MNRKDFIKASAILAASTVYLKSFAHPLTSFNQQIRVALIGANGMGWSNLNALLKTNRAVCTVLCDIDENVLQKRANELKERGIEVKTCVDYKDVLRDSNVDAVIIATPDHWHCLQFVDAVKAGKHVYVEKPIGNSIRECEVMLATEKKGNVIVQVGQWQRSQQHFQDALDYVHSGKLGNIRLVKAWSYVGWKKNIVKKPDTAVPAGVHYDRWLGPAQKRAFNPNRFHFEFRWFWDYAGGLMTDWGVHMLDYALMGMKATTPKSIMATGGNFADPNGAAETPDTLTAVYEFDNFYIQWEHALGMDLGPYDRTHGVAFIGNNGTLIVNRNGWEVIPEKDGGPAVPLQKSSDNGLEKHMVNFVDAIVAKDKGMLKAPLEAGAHIAIFSQMGNVAYRTGRKIYWDKGKQRFTDSEANKYLAAPYHNGYKIPHES
ncbi:Gfo/Idh/MocA family protein [Sphingobacterium psychroaquaticum]|uniref:Predicted dehydrogenase n=1 Tax=Sphingobacterium psychroaquaticum TaxID=561061 RepID=A0A1X7J1I3_9SPHI|nr:Gfo/Idh/MocA family oxidoreductase [Sphingobacterium psychroaquaticum]SMG21528.1 Predicted dehydrogenase [Sphingobacterium psychroaquaticum]